MLQMITITVEHSAHFVFLLGLLCMLKRKLLENKEDVPACLYHCSL